MSSSIQVGIRVKPSNNSISDWIIDPENGSIETGNGGSVYKFNHVFPSDSQTIEIYDTMSSSVIQSFVNGANGTIFAYGSTGSGKTFTMMGNDDFPGIIPLAVEHIFNCLFQNQSNVYKVSFSYFEIYNEKIRDLLDPRNNDKHYTSIIAKNAEMVFETIKAADINRATGTTSMNEHSSRSHAIVRIVLESQPRNVRGVVYKSVLNLVDLAGSESQKNTNAEGNRQIEASNINKSLLALSKLINAVQKGKNVASYRDSVLTYYLRDSIGGSAHTAIICAINSDSSQKSTSESTLKFAQTAMKIKNEPKINKCMTYEARIHELEQEVEMLRGIVKECDQTFENQDTSQLDQTRYITLTPKVSNKKKERKIKDEVQNIKNSNSLINEVDGYCSTSGSEYSNDGNLASGSDEVADYYYTDDSDDIFSEKLPVLPKKAPKRNKDLLLILPSKEKQESTIINKDDKNDETKQILDDESTIEMAETINSSMTPIILPKKKKSVNLFSFINEEKELFKANDSHVQNENNEENLQKTKILELENKIAELNIQIEDQKTIIQKITHESAEKDNLIKSLRIENTEKANQVKQLNQQTIQLKLDFEKEIDLIKDQEALNHNKKIEIIENHVKIVEEEKANLSKENEKLKLEILNMKKDFITEKNEISNSIQLNNEISLLKDKVENLNKIIMTKDAQIKGNNINISSLRNTNQQKDSLLVRLGEKIENQKMEITKITKENEIIKQEKEKLDNQISILQKQNEIFSQNNKIKYAQSVLQHSQLSNCNDTTTKPSETSIKLSNENLNGHQKYEKLKEHINRQLSEVDENILKHNSNYFINGNIKAPSGQYHVNIARQPLQPKSSRLTNQYEIPQHVMQKVQQTIDSNTKGPRFISKFTSSANNLIKHKVKLGLFTSLEYESNENKNELDLSSEPTLQISNIGVNTDINQINKEEKETQTKVRFEGYQYLQMMNENQDSDETVISLFRRSQTFEIVEERDHLSNFLYLFSIFINFLHWLFFIYSISTI